MRQPVPFGKYLLLDRISVGGMAEVFKAKSYGVEGFEKIIAIKRILPTMGEDRDFIKMFIDEAKIAGQLAHANVCQIFELGRIDGSHFIAMEYIWGKDLLQIQNRLRKLKRPMPIAMACFVIAKVLEGLDYAHRKRDPLGRPLEIVHRDCSPQNVLVSYEGEVKVIDFGIAKATSRNSRTMAGVLKGKFGYMSPEQVRGLPLDRRSDIFALGTMLYECLTGERLFQGETDFSTLEKVRNVDVPNPRTVNPDIPEAIERVIMKALAKDVEDRYQWCSDMLADLQTYLMSQDVVFTAKSLSLWLKDVFAQEIDKERAQLEQYKRVGRDGLIAGVPAAQAKLDVVATLGEAGAPEGDATQLGGPDFADLEALLSAGAAPQVGPAPGSPAARGGTTPEPARARDRDFASEFSEEAPTEIFGEAHEAALPTPAPAAPAAPAAAAARPSRSQPQTRPPRPPPGRSPMPEMAAAAVLEAQRPAMAPPPDGDAGFLAARGSHQDAMAAALPPQAYGSNPAATPFGGGASVDRQSASGGLTPGAALGAPPNPGNKTMIGTAVPLGSLAPGLRPTGQQAPYAAPQGYPPPAAPPGAHGFAPGQIQAMPPYSSPPSGEYPQPIAAAEQAMAAPRAPARNRSSIGRDVAIGAAIAGVVLGGLLAVKFLVLDSGGATASRADAAGQKQIATLALSLPDGVSAELFVDGARIATVRNRVEVPVSAGTRTVKLAGPNGGSCEQTVELEGGKTLPLACELKAPPATDAATAIGSAGSAAGSTGGEAAATGTGSGSAAPDAVAHAGSGVGVGSAASDAAGASPGPAVDKPTDKPADEPADKPADEPTRPRERTPRPPTETARKPAADANGYLTLSSTPPAKVLVDGEDTGLTTPVTGKQLPVAPGRHKVTFVFGSDKYHQAVIVKAGKTHNVTKSLE